MALVIVGHEKWNMMNHNKVSHNKFFVLFEEIIFLKITLVARYKTSMNCLIVTHKKRIEWHLAILLYVSAILLFTLI